jgi:hypothetical protein
MNRETKVGLVVAASFVCLTGGVFATKYLHKAATAPEAAPAPEKPAAGEEQQAAPPTAPLYKPPEVPPSLDPPPFEPNSKPKELGPPELTPLKPAAAKHEDPSKDDEFIPTLPAPSKSAPPTRGDAESLPLLPVPSQPAKSGPPALDLDSPPAAKDHKKATKIPSAEDTLGPPPSGGVTRVANPPKPADPPELIDLPVPADKKKDDEKKKDLPKPAAPKDDLPGLTLPAPTGGPVELPPPGGDKPAGEKPAPAAPKTEKPAGDKPPIDLAAPPPMPVGNKSADGPKPFDLPPDLTPPKKPEPSKSPEHTKPPIDLPGPPAKVIPAPPAESRDDSASAPPKNGGAGAAASLTRPAPANDAPTPPEAPVTSYDEEWYYCKQGDTLAGISQRFFFTPKYEQALRQYNLDRNYQASFRQERPSLSPGQVVKVPPARILEKLYPASLPGARPAPNPRGDSPANIPSTPTPGGEDLGSPREYQVRRDGMTLRDIAREELKDANQWTRIFMLNREWNPSAPIPVGTKLFLPRSQ